MSIPLNAHEVFAAHQDYIERALKIVCSRQRLLGADAEDFCSALRLRLIEDDCAILRKFEGRSSVQTYLVSVVMHFFQDWRNARWGKWRPSAEARRLGPIAVEFETLRTRDDLGFEAAAEMLRARHAISRADVEAIAVRLPSRHNRAFVSESEVVNLPSGMTSPDAAVLAQELAVEAERATTAVREAIAALPAQDQLIVRMLVDDGLTVAVISRTLKLQQKPLYRRIRAVLASLRSRLEEQGFSAATMGELFRNGGFEAADGESSAKTSEPVRLFSGNDRNQKVKRLTP